MTPTDPLTVTQVAQALGISRAMAYKLVENRHIESYRYAGAIRVTRAALDDYRERCRVPARATR